MPRLHVEIAQRGSFHPELVYTLDNVPSLPHPSCQLHLYQQLIASLFIDPYQLAGLESTLGVVKYAGEVDLEKPLGQVDTRGSAFAVPLAGKEGETVRVPVHVRYQTPTTRGLYETLEVDEATLAWTCPVTYSEPDHEVFTDTLGVFDPNVRAYQVPGIRHSDTDRTLRIPVGQLGDMFMVQSVTAIVIVMATVLVAGMAWTKRFRQ